MKEYIVLVDESTLEQDELEWFKEQGAKELIRCKDCKFAEKNFAKLHLDSAKKTIGSVLTGNGSDLKATMTI